MAKIIGLLSASYSGTTMMTTILGGHSKVFPAGETNWIERTDPTKYRCLTCEGQCSHWTPSVLREIIKSRHRFEPMRRHFSQYDWVVSSDKTPNYYIEFGHPDYFILQWKDPRSWFYSARKHEGREIDQAISAWCSLYERSIELVDRENLSIPVSYIDWDKFCVDPEARIKDLWLKLGLAAESHPDGLLRDKMHMMGGNLEAQGLQQGKDYNEFFNNGVRPDDRWQWNLDRQENERIIKNNRIEAVVKELNRRAYRDPCSNKYSSDGGSKLIVDSTLSSNAVPLICEDIQKRNKAAIRKGVSAYDRYKEFPLNGFFQVKPTHAGPAIIQFTNNDCSITRRLVLNGPGSFEPRELNLWFQLAKVCRSILDVGAFTGIYGLYAARSNSHCNIIALEPNHLAFNRILINTKINALVGRLHPMLVGAGSKFEVSKLRHPFGIYTIASGESFAEERIPKPAFETTAQIITIDSIYKASEATEDQRVLKAINPSLPEIGLPDLVKMDIEGFELQAMRGMLGTVKKSAPTILWECFNEKAFFEIVNMLDGYEHKVLSSGATLRLKNDFKPGNFLSVHASRSQHVEVVESIYQHE